MTCENMVTFEIGEKYTIPCGGAFRWFASTATVFCPECMDKQSKDKPQAKEEQQ